MESPLTFAALEAKINAMQQHPYASTDMPKRARWGLAIGFIAAVLCLLAGKFLPASHLSTAIIAGTCLVVELVGLAIGLAAQLPRSWPTFVSERREAAEELDFDLPHHQDLIRWLQGHPRERLEKLSDYASYRLERSRERLPMLTGGIEKLGALPVFIALFIQFKDAQWPPHPSWLEIVLVFALVLSYWMSLLQINVRFRLQSYDMLLKKALKGQLEIV
ncbi:hypothetical protein [Rhodanobacter sp. L36]|uniref:hypothetical protein n=1 Tax=Rhodanobacter sp. L36 TaxID=1747221 RepID=UPI00131BFB7F|nr:hypothetical protein [Rhodanobacter sp. L36]